ARNLEHRAALDPTLEPDHGSPTGRLRRDDPELLSCEVQRAADLEPSRVLTCVLDEEGAVEPVRPPDAADDHAVSHAARARLPAARSSRLPPLATGRRARSRRGTRGLRRRGARR